MTAAPTTSKRPRVLIVEDDMMSRTLLMSALKKEGYEFAVARNGQEAIDLYSQEFFPIIITDWLMPEMDGLELCRLIRSMKIDRYIYIIILTGQNSKTDLVKGLEAGADEYMVKPIHQAELRVRLKGACRILELETSLKKNMAEIREISIRDRLTGIFNRVYMDHHLSQEIIRSSRYHHSLSVLMCDLDHFKVINDTYGHLAGDDVLRACVDHISASFRQGVDWLARYGGEEFVVVLPETDLTGALHVAERMRVRIASTPVNFAGCEIEITASFGSVTVIPSFNGQVRYMEQVLNVADTCLYQAKNSGRNRIVSAEM
ncbi:MAG: diguanylate cyclase [Geobacteraceae bacterium]|nr:diguanylate cyclase [Geobacteraceae bacterium]